MAFTGVANGNFEAGSYVDGGSGFQTITAPNSSTITGWTVSSGSIDWIGSYWQPANGTKSLDLSGNGPGRITQTFATTVNNTYVVTFALSGNPAGLPTAKTLTVSATGGAPVIYTYDTAAQGNTLANMKWTLHTYTFVASGSSTTLTFASTTAGAYGPALDNVVVNETNIATAATCKKGGWKTLHDNLGNGFKNQGDCVSYYATGGRNPGSVTP